MKLFGTNVKKERYKGTIKKPQEDMLERRVLLIVAVAFAAVLVFVGVHIFIRGGAVDENTVKYVSLTNAETGSKEVYGAGSDHLGNVTNINGLRPISCYGDSFANTPDDSSISYPGVLSVLAQRTVYNVATNSDTIYETAARQGGVPAEVSPFIIPPSKSSTEVLVRNIDGRNLMFDFSKNGGLNPCVIQGVEGLLSLIDDKYYFTRADSGEETLVLNPTTVESRAMQLRRNDISVFFLGDDEIFKTPEEAVEIYRKMVDYLDEDNKSYIVVGPIKGDVAVLDAANKALAEEFGENYLDLRNYLLTEADENLNITLSEDDRILAENGIVPYVYFLESDFLSIQGADAVGSAIYEKLNSLNYFTDAIDTNKNNK